MGCRWRTPAAAGGAGGEDTARISTRGSPWPLCSPREQRPAVVKISGRLRPALRVEPAGGPAACGALHAQLALNHHAGAKSSTMAGRRAGMRPRAGSCRARALPPRAPR
jgi:hypothetical protein